MKKEHLILFKSGLIVSVFFTMAIFGCKKPDSSTTSESCTLDCKNGGTWSDNACNCPPEWSGANCETYYTDTYKGVYSSNNYNCGMGVGTQSYLVTVDQGNRNRIKIGAILADMTDLTHFVIPQQPTFIGGSGTIDGKNMNLSFTFTSTTFTNVVLTQSCSASFTKN
ncbi:MAG: hypothetical protein IT236_14200 [Bacteroidia bacterium]|nr:hypothetical protein [Bacteroidia bacterium]